MCRSAFESDCSRRSILGSHGEEKETSHFSKKEKINQPIAFPRILTEMFRIASNMSATLHVSFEIYD